LDSSGSGQQKIGTPVSEIALTGDANTTDDARLAVSIRNVDIQYRVYEDKFFSTRELASRGFRSRKSTVVQAIRNVSLDIPVGQAIGIVGPNGSGKSTLLRAIAGVQSLANGHIYVRGNARLLGVGAALKPALSGYRNVLLGGLAMGMPRSEILEQMDYIVDFSGLGDAMGRPLNTYSSGMRARLAFSIATIRVPDILLVDEALAVGDRDFRKRSLARLNDIRDQAGTVVMVTHNLNEIRQTCSRVLWLENGTVCTHGGVDEVLSRYAQRI
jgi:teichoic acid transport system ATP-binding protein